jgi:hypothetical protein
MLELMAQGQLPHPTNGQEPDWTTFQQHAAEGLPSVQPGMPLMVVLAIIADYLRDNGFVQNLSYSQNKRAIACQFTTCPWADCCPSAHHQSLTCHLLRQLVQTTLARAGYPEGFKALTHLTIEINHCTGKPCLPQKAPI